MSPTATTTRPHPSRELHGRALLDVATGVVMARTGSDAATARHDLLTTAQTHRVSPFRLARSVLLRSAGITPATPTVEDDVAQLAWGRLLPETASSTTGGAP